MKVISVITFNTFNFNVIVNEINESYLGSISIMMTELVLMSTIKTVRENCQTIREHSGAYKKQVENLYLKFCYKYGSIFGS